MAEVKCYVCESPLSTQQGRAFCSNDGCPSGGLFLRCGYCKAFSFSIHPEQMACANPGCTMHGVKRSFCQACNKTSMITYAAKTFCMNRNCTTNKKVIRKCFFCGNRSFLAIPEVRICTKGDCEHLLHTMVECRRCEKPTFEKEKSRCRNVACAYADIRIDDCPSCHRTSYVQEAGHEEFARCLEPDCDRHKDRAAATEAAVARRGPETPVTEEPVVDPTLGVDLIVYSDDIPTPDPGRPPQFAPGIAPEIAPEAETPPPVTPAEEEPIFPETRSERRRRVLAEDTEYDRTPSGRRPRTGPGRSKDRLAADLILGPEGAPAGGAGDAPSGAPPQASPGKSLHPELDDGFEVPLPSSLTRPKEPPTRSAPSGRDKPIFEIEGEPPRVTPEQKTERVGGPAKQARPSAPREEPPVEPAAPAVTEMFRDHLLRDGEGNALPNIVVVGLRGSGRTNYLTMLGEILAHRGFRYHFPWSDIEVHRVDAAERVRAHIERGGDGAARTPEQIADFARRVRDLAYEYAPDHLGAFIGKEQWAEPSRQGGNGSYPRFLASRILRGGELLAQVVAVQMPPSENDEAIRSVRDLLREPSDAPSPRTPLVEALREATGLVILLDPQNESNADAYLDVFRLLAESVALRGRAALRERTREILGGDGSDPDDATLDEMIGAFLHGAPGDEGPVRTALQEALADFEVSQDFERGFQALHREEGQAPALPHLRHVAVAVTKSDMYPVVSPAERYPDRKMPKCKAGIRALDGHLRLCGGGLRFYNTSATGFSILKDTVYYPGKENILTPINVAEPIFDMILD